MVSSKDKAKKICAYLRPANKWLLDLIYAEAAKEGFSLSTDQASRLLWLTVQRMVEGPQTPHLQNDPGVSIEPTDDLHMLAGRLFEGAYYDVVAVHLSHMPGFQKRQAGAPRKDLLASEAASLKREGMSYAQIAIRLNQIHGKDTTTQENVRGLLKSRRLKPQKAATPPDKTRS